MIPSTGLVAGHMECASLKETLPVLTELLAFEKVSDEPGEVVLKHPNTDWLLVVHEAGPTAPEKEMHNHFGVRVAKNEEVEAAYEFLRNRAPQYGIHSFVEPSYAHASYSVYFIEPGTNMWEIECYEHAIRKQSEWSRLGGVRTPHWKQTLAPEKFPGRGYVPQGFTHGTLACRDVPTSERFYTRVLGLETHHPTPRVVYIKHANTRCYVVSQPKPQWKTHSPNFRFTLSVESADALLGAHRWLQESGSELGVTELGDVQNQNGTTFFLLRDPDRNCWEVAASQRGD